jgi:myosin heavy subunit
LNHTISFQASDFNKVMSAFRVLDFSAAATDSIWALTAAILHLGNLDIFLDENDSASIRGAIHQCLRIILNLDS